MNFFKTALIGFLRSVFFLVLMSLIFHMCFSGFIEKAVTEIFLTSNSSIEVFEKFNIDRSTLEKAGNSELINNFLNEIIDGFFYDFGHREVVKNKNLINKIQNFVIDNRDELEDFIGYKIYDEFIDSIDNIVELQAVEAKYVELVMDEDIPNVIRSFVLVFYKLSQFSYVYLSIVFLVIILGIIIVLYLPSLEWLKCVGKDVFYGGLLMFCILCIIHYIVSTITFNMPLHIPFNFMNAFMFIVGFIVLGILISQSYFVIMKIKSKKKVGDLSEIS